MGRRVPELLEVAERLVDLAPAHRGEGQDVVRPFERLRTPQRLGVRQHLRPDLGLLGKSTPEEEEVRLVRQQAQPGRRDLGDPRGGLKLGQGRVALQDGRLRVAHALPGVADPAALFHLINLMRERGHSLLLTGSAPPAQWPFSLPDLMSRLKAMPAQGIAEPGDALLGAVLVKLFADRQLAVGEEVVKYLVPRIERSFHAARHWVAALDAAALAESRAVTVALARKLLEQAAD